MPLSRKYEFVSAVPVWEKGAEKEKNFTLGARCTLGRNAKVSLHIAAHCRFRILINGKYFASGPARAAHGYYRVDEYALSHALTEEKNTLAIFTAGYNVNSFYLLDEPSFLCAEIVGESGVLFATGTKKDFEYTRVRQRLTRVQRYSFQRPFTESYRYGADHDGFELGSENRAPVQTGKTEEKRFIERRVAYCGNTEISARSICRTGKTAPVKFPRPYTDRSYCKIGEKLGGFTAHELEFNAVRAARSVRLKGKAETVTLSADNFALNGDNFAVYDFGFDTTGYFRVRIHAGDDVRLCLTFNQKLPEKGFADPTENGCCNIVFWDLKGGRSYDLVTFEPYTARFVQLTATGTAIVEGVSQYREAMPESELINLKKMPDAQLQKIYDAAVETFVQNTTDIFMDCPSRERAGWLCDAWFTSQVERELTGKSTVDCCFLENFIMAESFKDIPEGMLPMCYPSDHYDGVYIPNWAMWYVLQLYEHEKACRDGLYLDAKERVYALARFFAGYENESGLLEKLDSWVFVEWSEANSYVQDINYPTNMLYARFLECIGEMYGDENMTRKAKRVKAETVKQSFDGKFFRDNAVLKNGKAEVTENRTETCQYYAFFTGTATKESHPELWNTLLTEFGTVRDKKDLHPEISRSNAFIGNYLRLILMMQAGEKEALLSDIRGFFLPMAEKTGTLWENMDDGASCNHGFASFAALILNRITD